MQLGCIDEALDLIVVPRWQRAQQIQLLENAHVLLCRHVGDGQGRTEAGVIHQLPRVLSEDAQQSRHLPQMIYFGDVTHVTLDDGFEVVQKPFLSARPGGTLQDFRVTSG